MWTRLLAIAETVELSDVCNLIIPVGRPQKYWKHISLNTNLSQPSPSSIQNNVEPKILSNKKLRYETADWDGQFRDICFESCWQRQNLRVEY